MIELQSRLDCAIYLSYVFYREFMIIIPCPNVRSKLYN